MEACVCVLCRMFYFFFESRNSKEDPVVIWLTGGPGCSSELAVFYENGPFSIANNLSLVLNNYGWDKVLQLRRVLWVQYFQGLLCQSVRSGMSGYCVARTDKPVLTVLTYKIRCAPRSTDVSCCIVPIAHLHVRFVIMVLLFKKGFFFFMYICLFLLFRFTILINDFSYLWH